jgi:hypothetical protein
MVVEVPLPTDDPQSRDWLAPRTHNKGYHSKPSFPQRLSRRALTHINTPAPTSLKKSQRGVSWRSDFGVIGRRKMEEDRIEALRLHRDSTEESLARRNFAVIIKCRCPHRNLNPHFRTAKRKTKCLCVQKYRRQGTAIVNISWNHRTRHVRQHWDLTKPPSDEFSWRPAAPLASVAVAPGCLRAAVHDTHRHWDTFSRLPLPWRCKTTVS